MESLKSQIKSNFESLSFNEALKANESLFTEYERVHGRRSLNAMIAYYRKKSEREEAEAVAEPAAEVEQTAEAEITEEESKSQAEAEPEAETETNAEVEAEAEAEEEEKDEPTGEDEKSEQAEKPQFHFTIGTEFNRQQIEEAIADKSQQVFAKFCIIEEYFEQVSDDQAIRRISMWLSPYCDGYEKWDDASKVAKEHNIVSQRKPGNFDLSKKGLPVGEIYRKATVMRISDAIKKFYLERGEGELALTRVYDIESAK